MLNDFGKNFIEIFVFKIGIATLTW